MRIEYEDFNETDLNIDCIYGENKDGRSYGRDPLTHLFPKCGNAGGFRPATREDGSGKYAYIVLTTTMDKLEWPDHINEETGIFKYHGDNRKPGRELTDTKKKGNKILEEVFDLLNSDESLEDMPPFFIFKNTGNGLDMQFLGLAVPGNPSISPDEDLVARWKTMDGKRFQNYEAYFTILNTRKISYQWLNSLIHNHENNLKYAPDAWKEFIKKGRSGIKALKAQKTKIGIPTPQQQMDCDKEGEKCINIIYNRYKDKKNAFKFEACAVEIIKMMDSNFTDIQLTRPVKDGGRDAIGKYQINTGGNCHEPLEFDCSIEAKCNGSKNGVGVKEMSRLISRLRHRQFGILITTSYVNKQAYEEILKDEHPILIITATDIAAILRSNSKTSENIDKWLDDIEENDDRY